METKNKVNFNDVEIGNLIQYFDHGTRDEIKIYKVTKIDKKTYNGGYANYYKFITMELYFVPNGNVEFYKEVGTNVRDLTFWEHNFEYLAPEYYELIDLKNIYNQIHNTNY